MKSCGVILMKPNEYTLCDKGRDRQAAAGRGAGRAAGSPSPADHGAQQPRVPRLVLVVQQRVGRVADRQRRDHASEVRHRLLVVRLCVGEHVRVGRRELQPRPPRPDWPAQRDRLDDLAQLPGLDEQADAVGEEDDLGEPRRGEPRPRLHRRGVARRRLAQEVSESRR